MDSFFDIYESVENNIQNKADPKVAETKLQDLVDFLAENMTKKQKYATGSNLCIGDFCIAALYNSLAKNLSYKHKNKHIEIWDS